MGKGLVMFQRVVVVGGGGRVGREVLTLLARRSFPVGHVVALSSSRSAGTTIDVPGRFGAVSLEDSSDFVFHRGDLVFFCAGSAVSQMHVPRALDVGATVIDKSSFFRLDPHVPLIIPEVNGDLIGHHKPGLIATPNCIAVPLAMSLKPLRDLGPIDRVVVSTYQSVSGAGNGGMAELEHQTRAVLDGRDSPPHYFQQPIAFNVIPQIDAVCKTGYTGEEEKVMAETRKILQDDFAISVTCVRVPVFVGHCLSVHVTFRKAVDLTSIRSAMVCYPGLTVLPAHGLADVDATPRRVEGTDSVMISRLRLDPGGTFGVSYWAACDNLRKGAALNGVQIAELLIKKDF